MLNNNNSNNSLSALSLCGADCSKCSYLSECGGCNANGGKPFFIFGNDCEIFQCASSKKVKGCGGCDSANCSTFKSVIPPSVVDKDTYILQKAYNLKEAARKRNSGLGIRFGEYRVEKSKGEDKK